MRSKALYFPYISPPQGRWLYLMLLYWDQLSSISPYESLHSRNRLPPHMYQLVEEGLINPIIPAELIGDIEDFGQPFLGFVEKRIRTRKTQRHHSPVRTPIHVEKLGHIAQNLVELGVASPANYPWYEMDSWVANAFMSYLACVLGSLPEVNSVPITNEESCFQVLGAGGYKQYARLDSHRRVILEDLFPFPMGDIDIPSIIKFKQKHGAQLDRFRNKIEGLCVDLSVIAESDLREQRSQAITQELREEIDDISSRLRESWGEVVFLDILPILGASDSFVNVLQGDHTISSGLGSLSLPAAIVSYLGRRRDRNSLLNRPLAYGALLHRHFSKTTAQTKRDT
ncbi:hypothetical protein DEALK_18260 [Dehalogenimonas alkenigignens]|uniref:Uncharacterized protein n=2 Tax=Dehalogenimonas alkenigignens TaxID=1217799 RepID=A0A0W0GKD2_9CHLR|nr:hypothetical protein DEALK_18260 [Dehalogenimonas alkenigignens]